MNKHRPYNNLIERKLEQLPGADADHLWNDMHSILDKKMPEKKERRRFIFWLFRDSGVLLMSLLCLFIGGASIFILSPKHSSIVVANNTRSAPSNILTDDDQISVSKSHDQGATISSNTNLQLSHPSDNISLERSSVKLFDRPIVITADQRTDNFNGYTPAYMADNSDYEPSEIVITRNSLTKFDPVISAKKYDDSRLSVSNKGIDSLIKQSDLSIKQPIRNGNNDQGFYSGILSGLDLSSIHFKSLKTGSAKGIILGYALNKKWSIESGVYWDTKRVYDDGRFFNPPGNSSASGITITDVNGKSRLYEIPLNIRYNILAAKNKLFTTAGLSSYIMKSENYDYEYTQNNQPAGHNYLSYKNATKNLLAVANVSLGYEHKFGSTGSFRVESYLKLPLTNIGVAKMPIMSTGINVGFIKKIK